MAQVCHVLAHCLYPGGLLLCALVTSLAIVKFVRVPLLWYSPSSPVTWAAEGSGSCSSLAEDVSLDPGGLYFIIIAKCPEEGSLLILLSFLVIG